MFAIHDLLPISKLRRHKLSELSELHISMFFRTMSVGLIGIFIPIYFYNLGYSLEEIAIYYIFFWIARIFLDHLQAKLLLKIGVKHLIIFSYFVMWVQLLLLLLMPHTYIPIALVLVTGAAAMGGFWTGFHTDISLNAKKRQGEESSKIYSINKLAGAIAPILGGAIAGLFGIQVTIMLSVVLAILAAIPLLSTPDQSGNIFYIPKPKDYLKLKKLFRLSLGDGFIYSVSAIAWPLFMALFIFSNDSYFSVGLVAGISLLVAVVSALIFGVLSDRGMSLLLFRTGAIFGYILNIVRPLTTSFSSALGLGVLAEPAQASVQVPLGRFYYKRGGKDDEKSLAFVLIWTAYNQLSRALFFLILLIFLLAFTDRFALQAIFLATSLASLILLSARKQWFK